MIGLPNALSAVVEERKVTDYLLADSHPAGRAKAAFFRRFGYSSDEPSKLRDALEHARLSPVIAIVDTPFGRKFVLEGTLPASDGRRPRVRSVWFVELHQAAAKLVTAYPVPGADR